MRVIAAGEAAERRPGLDRDLAVGLGRQRQNNLASVDVAFDARQPLRWAFSGDDAVETLQALDLMRGVPAHALAAVAELFHQRSERGETLVEVGIVARDDAHARHGLAGKGLAFAALPVLDVERLRDFGGRVVQDGRENDIGFDAQHLRRNLREGSGEALVDLPVRTRLPGRVDRRRQRMNEGMHVGGVEIVLLVPGGGGKDDVGIDAGRRHAEIERHEEIKLALRRRVAPHHVHRLLQAHLAKVLAEHAILGAEQMLEEIFVPLAGRAQQVGAPDKEIARPILRRVGVVAGHVEIARLQRPGDIVLRLEAGCGGLGGDAERVLFQLRRRGQPAHALGAHVVVDQRSIPRAGGRGRRKDVLHVERFIAPLVGMGVERGRAVDLARRARPVEAEGQRQPARLRPQFFLPDIMRPAAARFADAAAHHQHVDDAAIVHVHVVPMVHRRADDDHGASVRLLRVAREFARRRFHLCARHAGNALAPGRGVGDIVRVVLRDIGAAEAAIEAVIGQQQIEDGRHLRLALDQLHRPEGHVAQQHIRMFRALEVIVLAIAEIGEAHLGHAVVGVGQRQPQFRRRARRLFLEIPGALLAPAEADGAIGNHGRARDFIQRDGFPFGIVGMAQRGVEVGGAQESLRHVAAVLHDEAHQHRHVGILADIVEEIGNLTVDVEFLQDHVPHRHRDGRVRALLHGDPHVGEFRRFRIVGADHDAFRALVASFGVEMRIGRARLRHVRAPEDEEARIVPVGAFGHVGLFAPGHRRGRRQVAIPVVERHADAAHQREISRPRGIADHRHRGDRREAEDAIGAVGFRGIGVGGGDEFADFVPVGAHEAAEPALADVRSALLWIFDDRFPGRDRRQRLARLAPQPHQARTHQRIFHAVAGIEIPGIARAARAAARFVVGQVGSGAGIVRLLGLPGDDAAFDIDLPGTRPGAVHAMRRARDLVVLPALAVAVLPVAVFSGDDSVAVGEGFAGAGEERQSVEKMTHRGLLCAPIRRAGKGGARGRHGGGCR